MRLHEVIAAYLQHMLYSLLYRVITLTLTSF